MKSSPTLQRAVLTSTVATGPLPGSSCASTTAPVARRFGFAFRSRISACSRIWSSSDCRCPVPFFAEISLESDGTAEFLEHDAVLKQILLHLASDWQPGRSILLIATIIGTPAFLACEIASIVCGIT